MKAREICEAGKEALRSGKYNMVRINFGESQILSIQLFCRKDLHVHALCNGDGCSFCCSQP